MSAPPFCSGYFKTFCLMAYFSCANMSLLPPIFFHCDTRHELEGFSMAPFPGSIAFFSGIFSHHLFLTGPVLGLWLLSV